MAKAKTTSKVATAAKSPDGTKAGAARREANSPTAASRARDRIRQGARNDYHATQDRKRRMPPRTKLASEDKVLNKHNRRKLQATTRDLRRNYVVSAWMLRTHLSYVASFTFQSQMDEQQYPGLNERIEDLIELAGRPENFDVTGRFGVEDFIELSEGARTIDGDICWLKLPGTGTVQAIESDRIRAPESGAPPGFVPSNWTHGIRTDKAGKPLEYCICDRAAKGEGFVFQRIVPASSVWLHGYFDRFDQLRGVSPLAPVINTLQDCYENFDYALAKAKIASMLGLVFFKQSAGGVADHVEQFGDVAEDAGEGDEPASETAQSRYEWLLDGRPFQVELDQDDDAKFLNVDTPGQSFTEFTGVMLGLSLKALDIPRSFFDENFTNYYGQKGARGHYLSASRRKRRQNQHLLRRWTYWRTALMVADGALELPEGLTVPELKFGWMPTAMAPIQLLQDMKGHEKAMALNLASPQSVGSELGIDPRDMVRQKLEMELHEARLRKEMVTPAPSQAPTLPPPQDGSGDGEGDGDGNA